MALQHQGDSPTYRPFEQRDFEPAAELFYQQWGTEAGERLGRLDAQVNLCNYLMDADWGLVAEGAGRRASGRASRRDRLPTGRRTIRVARQARRSFLPRLHQAPPLAARSAGLRPRSWRSRSGSAPRRTRVGAGGSGGVQAPDCEPGCPRAGRRRRPREPWRGPSCADGSHRLLPHHRRHL